jgi:hypothetical protein
MNTYQREVARHLADMSRGRTRTMTLEVSEALYAMLGRIAEDRGMTPEKFAVHILSGGE